MAKFDEKATWPGWETVRLIGRGSFGAVYEIRRDVFGDVEKAALKVISIPQNGGDVDELRNDGYDDESITSTFQAHLQNIVAEYSLMRKLKGHANVVYCDDVKYVQHEDGFGWDIYIKMELLTPMVDVIPVDASEETVVKFAKDMCQALEVCKKHNIVHRDIKPQNIFVSDNGDFKLGDFGIAKTVEKTSGGTKIGTYKYMAPEVYNNRPYGAAADIYSLGMVLYWLLNERRMPFMPLPPQMPTASLEEQSRLRRLNGEPLPPPAHGSDGLKAIVLKACAYDQEDRPSAAEMLAALHALERGTFRSAEPTLPHYNDHRTAETYVDDDHDEGTVGAFGMGRDVSGLAAKPAPAISAEPAEELLNGDEDEGTTGVFHPIKPVVMPSPAPAYVADREESKPTQRFEPTEELLNGDEDEGTVGAFGSLSAKKTDGQSAVPVRETLKPAQQPVKQPVQQPAKQPVKQPVQQPAKQPVKQPVQQPAKQPVQQPAKQSAKQPAQQSAGKTGKSRKLLWLLIPAVALVAAAVVLLATGILGGGSGGLAIVTQPSDSRCAVGETAQFTVSAKGNGLSYQWEVLTADGLWKQVGLSDGRSATLSVPTTEDCNGRQYRCVVTDKKGKSQTSAAATLTVKFDFSAAQVGSTVRFGSYEQDNDTANGAEVIEWVVLAKEDDRLLVISKYALDCLQFHTERTAVTWETCSLRSWLNGTFMEQAFTSADRVLICSTTVTADANPLQSTSPGNDTTDQLFLLSIPEANRYFGSNDQRTCQRTEYCYAHGVFDDSQGNCSWWLRTPGDMESCAARVYCDGEIRDKGNYGDRWLNGVRPAMWIQVES